MQNLLLQDLKGEEWKDVCGYEGCYKISNLGRVKSIKRKAKCGHGLFTIPNKILKPQVDKKGYLYVSLWLNNTKKNGIIHQLVARTFLENKHNKPCINHKDGNKLNNSFLNLEFCTYQENNQHSIRILKNPKPPRICKLNEIQVRIIKRLKGVFSARVTSQYFNVGIYSVYDIWNNKSWKHLH